MSNLELTSRYKLIILLGERCRMCPEVKPNELEIDHIYDDGDTERAKFGSAEIYRYYLEHPEKAFQRLQVLCKGCHDFKTFQTHRKDIDGLTQTNDQNGKMMIFIDTLKELETVYKKPVSEQILVNRLKGVFAEDEARKYLKKLQRESAIYESKPGHYNLV